MTAARIVPVALLALGAAAVGRPAFAQQLKPLPRIVVDAYGFRTSLKGDEVTAADLGFPSSALPARAVGLRLGGQLFLHRTENRAIGIGVDVVRGLGRTNVFDSTGVLLATLTARIEGVAGVLSINFGHRDGWSYLSLGAGPMRVQTFAGTAPEAQPAGRLTANAGAGARWFITRHLAFGFDLRLYLTRAVGSAPGIAGRRHASLLLMSAGVAIK